LLGRRAGKTTLGTNLITETLLKGGKLGWFWPGYKIVEPFWNNYVELFSSITADKDETDHYLKLKTGGIIECWSFEAGIVGRSRDYDRVIIEEVIKAPKIKERWEKEVRPTLVDRAGDAFFFSSPNGDDDFKELYDIGDDEGGKVKIDPEWSSYRIPTWENPFLPKSERDRVYKLAEIDRDPVARQEYGAEFVSAAETFVPPQWVDACALWGDNWHPLGRDVPICVGLDAGYRNDSFAISGQGRDTLTGKYKTSFIRIFRPDELVNENGITSFARPKQFIRDVANSYRVISFAYDPFQLISTAGELADEGVGTFEEFSQTSKRAMADQNFYELIRDQKWSFSGVEHVELAQHVKNANSKIEGENRRRLVKRTDKLKIDGAVATSMALMSLPQYGTPGMVDEEIVFDLASLDGNGW
jgi:hypothetical protein